MEKYKTTSPWGTMAPKTQLSCLSLCRKLVRMVDDGEPIERRLGLFKVLEVPMRHHHEITTALLSTATGGKSKYKILKLLNQAQSKVTKKLHNEFVSDAKDDSKYLGTIELKRK